MIAQLLGRRSASLLNRLKVAGSNPEHRIFFLCVCFVVVVVVVVVVIVIVIVIVEAEQLLVISFFKTQPQFSCISLARDGLGSSYAALCHPPFSNSGW